MQQYSMTFPGAPLLEAHDGEHPDCLTQPDAVLRRQALLGQPHIQPLVDHVGELRSRGRGYVPDFDPADGGVEARLLFLMEKPGPKTCPPVGSGFVSRDNGGPTACTLRDFLTEAGIPRHGTVLWNTIPWWNGTVAMTGAEKRSGAAELTPLLQHLPRLRGVVLAGNLAAELGAPHFRHTDLKLFRSVHPSVQARIGPRSRERWLQLPTLWREAWQAVA